MFDDLHFMEKMTRTTKKEQAKISLSNFIMATEMISGILLTQKNEMFTIVKVKKKLEELT